MTLEQRVSLLERLYRCLRCGNNSQSGGVSIVDFSLDGSTLSITLKEPTGETKVLSVDLSSLYQNGNSIKSVELVGNTLEIKDSNGKSYSADLGKYVLKAQRNPKGDIDLKQGEQLLLTLHKTAETGQHNDLEGLQGGINNDYYHVTLENYDNLNGELGIWRN